MATKWWLPPPVDKRLRSVCARSSGSLYGVLGVASTASQQDIKAAYKRMVQSLHPDKHLQDNVDTTAAFLQCKLAYDILSDTQRRLEYDQLSSSIQARATKSAWQRQHQQPAWSWQQHAADSNAGAGHSAPTNPEAATAATAAGVSSSGLSAHLFRSPTGMHCPGVASAVQAGHGASCTTQSPAADFRQALLEQHDVVLEQFSSIQEAMEFMQNISQQQAVAGLAAEDYVQHPSSAVVVVPEGDTSSSGTSSRTSISTGSISSSASLRQKHKAGHSGKFIPTRASCSTMYRCTAFKEYNKF